MNEHIHFKRIRPRIYVETHLSPDEINHRINSQLKKDSCSCEGKSTKGYATIYPRITEQHFWSPQLTITLDVEDSKTRVRGLYGPKPSVWTMFVFFYAIIAFAILVVTMIGLSYWSLEMPATILWWIPVLILAFLSLYVVAYFGQKLGHRQMTNIHRFLEKCIGEKIEAD
jgi:hypothetical protein